MEADVEALAAFIHTSDVSMTVADPQLEDCPIISCNAAFQDLTGYSSSRTVGKNCRFLQQNVRKQADVPLLREAVRTSRSCVASLVNFKANGELFHNLVIIEPLILLSGHVLFVGCQFGFDLSIEDGKVLQEATTRYAAIDRLQNQMQRQLASGVRVSKQLRASAAIASVRNYKIQRLEPPQIDLSR